MSKVTGFLDFKTMNDVFLKCTNQIFTNKLILRQKMAYKITVAKCEEDSRGTVGLFD